jgi:DNA invertase Pin-like site-specific DNA recombinase
MSPKTPSQMDGYVRVSRVAGRAGDNFISPAVQREQIEGWAKLRGVTIAAWHEDLDQSGGKLDRPGLNTLLGRIEGGDTEGVIVAKLDRLSRLGVADALKLVERITDAGGSIAAVDLGLDPTTPFGEFGMTIMLAMARMERRRISDSWETAKTRAMDRGVRIGPTLIGYLRAESTLIIDPVRGPIISEAYRVAAREGIDAATEYLRRALPERRHTVFYTRRLLANRTYLGESHYGGRVERDAYPALTDRATWEAAQTERTNRRKPKADFPLSGIARCAGCGNSMVGARTGGGSQRGYRCSASLALYKGEKCTAPALTTAGPLEALVRDALRQARSGGWTIGGEPEGDLEGAERALLEAETELEAFGGDLTARRTFGTTYHAHLQTRADAVTEAQTRYRHEASKQARQTSVLSVELFDTEDPSELRELFDAALSAVIVTKGRGPIAERVRLVGYGDDGLTWVASSQDASLSGS